MTVLSDSEIKDLCSHSGFVISVYNRMSSKEIAVLVIGADWQKERIEYEKHVLFDSSVLKSWFAAGQPRTLAEYSTNFNVKSRSMTDEEKDAYRPMIAPFTSKSVRINEQGEKIMSYGLSSYGYDFRVADKFKIFTNTYSTIVDPKNFDPKAFVEHVGDVCIIPPNSFVLAHTVEQFHMPRNVVGVCVGKSTYARVGIQCLVTPVEPGWSGFLTLEFANTTPLPAKLYANEGGLQIMFLTGNPCETSYADRGGKYQNQCEEITLPKA